MEPRFRIGCCGFPVSKKDYYQRLNLVEIQQTFYKLPMLRTAERWRKEAPSEFEFTIKAWQGITHPPSSPTWRRAGVKLSEDEMDKYGFFKPTEQVFEAWEKTKEIARALGARVVVFQTPPRFGYSEENYSNVEQFFSAIDRGGMLMAWEPRGTWNQNLEKVRELCEKLDLIHVVDIMRRRPARITDVSYIRLHGLNPREFDYKYDYSDDELREIIRRARELGSSEIYILFNNTAMWKNALKLLEILEST